jgi:GxxExxY protein
MKTEFRSPPRWPQQEGANHRVTEDTEKREGSEWTSKTPLTQAVIGAAIEVHREMGPGLLESVYQKCLVHELRLRKIECEPQARLPIAYKGEIIYDEDLVMDVFVPGRLVVELKAVERLMPTHEAQVLTYLPLSKTRTGLLINFNVRLLKEGVKRMVL